jgi:Right handed beta helix region
MKRASFLVVVATIALLGFAVPANATHVSCGDTITVNTRLDSDVVCPGTAAYGLLIGANNITLHLGGFALRSPDPGGIVGVHQADIDATYSGVQIRAGRIEGFDSGVLVETTDSLAQRLTVTASTSGIDLRGDRNDALLNVVTLFEDPPGEQAGPGISISGAGAFVTRNTVGGIGTMMIAVSGDDPRVVVNTVECAPGSGDGILVDQYIDSAVVAKNTVTGCESIGFIVVPESAEFIGNGHVRRNVANGNGTGIQMVDATGLLWRNTANNNAFSGILAGPAGLTVTENTANSNGAYGIDAEPGVVDGGGNTASGNGALTGGIQCRNVSCGPSP